MFMALDGLGGAAGRTWMPEMPGCVFGAGMGIIVALGLWLAAKNPHVPDEAEDLEAAAESVEAVMTTDEAVQSQSNETR